MQKLDPKEFEFRLLMFMALAMETEKWAAHIKSHVNFDFKFRLNRFLESSAALQLFCKPYLDLEEFENTSEVFSMLIEMIKRRPPQERQQMIAFLKQSLEQKTTA